MTVVEALLRALSIQTVTLSLAVVAVRAMQALVVRRFGAGAGYLCWLLVPVAMLAVALPHAPADTLVVHVDVAAIAPAWLNASAPVSPGSTGVVVTALGAVWAAGAALLALVLARRQSRFDALIARTDASSPRLPAGTGPAVLGVLRPCIALPQDFDTAFDADERRLMLRHEDVHLRRRDNLWNLLASALLVVHWFNPIAWWAARRMRADQETSCDAAVLRREPGDVLAAYAGALLRVQGVALAPPLATTWQSIHPLVERVRMLQVHRISSGRHRNGRRLAALLIALGAIGGYTVRSNAGAPAAGAVSIMTELELRNVDADSNKTTTIAARLLSRDGQKVRVRFDAHGAGSGLREPVEVGLTTTRLDAGQLQMDVTLLRGEPLVELSSPRVITIDGTPARVEVKGKDGVYTLTLVPKVVDGNPPMPPTDALPAVPTTKASPPVPAVPPEAPPPPLPAVPPAPQRAL